MGRISIINKPTVGGISDGKEINMSYKITITNNETGEILGENDNAVAIIGAITDEKKTSCILFACCDAPDLACTVDGAENVISRIKRELPEIKAILQLR